MLTFVQLRANPNKLKKGLGHLGVKDHVSTSGVCPP